MRIITTLAALALPGACILIGILSFFSVPSKPNMVFGFRTRRSSSSLGAWQYANKLCGRLFLMSGILYLLAGLIGIIVLRNIPMEQYKEIVSVYAVSFMALIAASIIVTQVILSKKYDANGNIKNRPTTS